MGKDPLIPREHAAAVAAVLTAVGSLLLYLIDAGGRLDARLDALEEDAKVLVSPDGKIRPASESLEAHIRSLSNERRIERLEGLHHRH